MAESVSSSALRQRSPSLPEPRGAENQEERTEPNLPIIGLKSADQESGDTQQRVEDGQSQRRSRAHMYPRPAALSPGLSGRHVADSTRIQDPSNWRRGGGSAA